MDQVVKLVVRTGAYPAVCIGFWCYSRNKWIVCWISADLLRTSGTVIHSANSRFKVLRISALADLLNRDSHGGILCLRAPHIFSKEFWVLMWWLSRSSGEGTCFSFGGTLSRQWQLRDWVNSWLKIYFTRCIPWYYLFTIDDCPVVSVLAHPRLDRIGRCWVVPLPYTQIITFTLFIWKMFGI